MSKESEALNAFSIERKRYNKKCKGIQKFLEKDCSNPLSVWGFQFKENIKIFGEVDNVLYGAYHVQVVSKDDNEKWAWCPKQWDKKDGKSYCNHNTNLEFIED